MSVNYLNEAVQRTINKLDHKNIYKNLANGFEIDVAKIYLHQASKSYYWKQISLDWYQS